MVGIGRMAGFGYCRLGWSRRAGLAGVALVLGSMDWVSRDAGSRGGRYGVLCGHVIGSGHVVDHAHVTCCGHVTCPDHVTCDHVVAGSRIVPESMAFGWWWLSWKLLVLLLVWVL